MNMKKIITDIGIFGPYKEVITLNDRYRCDNSDLPFNVIGQSIVEDVLPNDFPEPIPDFYEIKKQIWQEIKRIRDKKTIQGGYKVADKWYHSDTFSRTQQMGMVMMGANLPAGIMWKTMDGSFVEMTSTLAGQIFAAAAAQDAALFGYAEYLKGLVESAGDPNSVDITAGWPETFVQ